MHTLTNYLPLSAFSPLSPLSLFARPPTHPKQTAGYILKQLHLSCVLSVEWTLNIEVKCLTLYCLGAFTGCLVFQQVVLRDFCGPAITAHGSLDLKQKNQIQIRTDFLVQSLKIMFRFLLVSLLVVGKLILINPLIALLYYISIYF
jgi:hypothetical protein